MSNAKTFRLELFISEEAARQIIGEAASNYWLDDYRPTWDIDACVLTLGRRGDNKRKGERSGESMIPAESTTITAADIAKALEKMAAGACDYCGSDVRKVFAAICEDLGPDGCGADGPTKDCVLQVAVFGKIVYG